MGLQKVSLAVDLNVQYSTKKIEFWTSIVQWNYFYHLWYLVLKQSWLETLDVLMLRCNHIIRNSARNRSESGVWTQ